VVTLRGLASPAARGRAIDLARAATGVLVVIDEIGIREE
jgi:osmotically-inducible protein OsmY